MILPDTPLSAELLLRPTIRQPDLTEILQPDMTRTIHLRLGRDTDGRPGRQPAYSRLHQRPRRTPPPRK